MARGEPVLGIDNFNAYYDPQLKEDRVAELWHRHGELLPAPEHSEAFGGFFDRFGDARVVLLGEATHGTAEFYRARADITKRLITEKGFCAVAVEADWPDAYRINYIQSHVRTRQWYKDGETFVWQDDEGKNPTYALPKTKRRTKHI